MNLIFGISWDPGSIAFINLPDPQSAWERSASLTFLPAPIPGNMSPNESQAAQESTALLGDRDRQKYRWGIIIGIGFSWLGSFLAALGIPCSFFTFGDSWLTYYRQHNHFHIVFDHRHRVQVHRHHFMAGICLFDRFDCNTAIMWEVK